MRRPVLCRREKFSSSHWGSMDIFRNVCPFGPTKKPVVVPNYLLRWLMKFSSKMPLVPWSWKVLARSCMRLSKTSYPTPTAGALALRQFSSVLLTLFSVLNAFEGALNTIKVKPATAKDGALRVYYRTALQELSVSTGLTMEQYRKKLDQNLAQTHAQLNSLGQPEGLLHPSTSETPVIPLYMAVPQTIFTIDESSEAEEDEWDFVDSDSQSDGTRSRDDSRKRSLPRKFLRRLIPSSMGRRGAK
ncbi:hypothetical protein EDB83DRAFT_1563251 [Lactarius deliciosus]|nr:hypothetical protein EDB83DRAFT_1563251 [Lactarius deliciosus]